MMLYLVLALVAAQRLVELAYAARNTRKLLERGAIEVDSWQHPLFVALHAAWLVAIAIAVPRDTIPNWWLLGVFALLQLARMWVLATLGPFWTTRIITLPGAPLVRRGPYRFLRHPNYAIVAGEIAVLPLAFGCWQIALIFSALNALLVSVRIRSEEAAISARRAAEYP